MQFDAQDIYAGEGSRNVGASVNSVSGQTGGAFGAIALVTQFTFAPAGTVPEPGSAALFAGAGISGLGLMLCRRKIK